MITPEQDSHESYAIAQIIRSNGGGINLFGSDIPHATTFRLSVKRAIVERDLGQDWYRPVDQKPVLEIEMSAHQFSELITSINSGSGTPVTLRKLDGRRFEDPPFVSQREQIRADFQSAIKKIYDDHERNKEGAVKRLDKDRLTSSDREAIIDAIRRNAIDWSGLKFLADQFEEALDKMTAQAKAEIDATVSRVQAEHGIRAIREMCGYGPQEASTTGLIEGEKETP